MHNFVGNKEMYILSNYNWIQFGKFKSPIL